MENPAGTVDLGSVEVEKPAAAAAPATEPKKEDKPMPKPAKKKTAAKKTPAKKAKGEKKTKASKAGHKAQGQVSMDCWKMLVARAKADDCREAEVVRRAVEKFVGFKAPKE